MITREEALEIIHNCRITSLGKFIHGYVVYQKTSNKIINDIFDEFEQHIKSLEAQLNTEQLTCDGCIYEDHDKDNSDECCECIRHNPKIDYYHPKDTK